MISKLMGAWPSLKLDDAGPVYADELKEMAGRYGRSVVENGITLAIRDTERPKAEFAPSVTILRSYVIRSIAGTATKRTCPMCEDAAGMVAVVSDGTVRKYADCWNIKPPMSFKMKPCGHEVAS